MSLLPHTMALLRVSSRRLPALLTSTRATSSTAGDSSSAHAPSSPPSDTPSASDAAATSVTASATAAASAASSDAPLFSMENPFLPERRQCIACRHDVRFNYKNVRLLSQFVSPFTGRMYGRHVTGLCKEQQNQLDAEYKKAVACGYIGVMMKEVEFLRDPKICDPTNPVRPHRF